MAKTKPCAFCGTEVKMGLLSEDWVDFDGIIPCCKECREKYKDSLEYHQDRFKAKLINYKRATKTKPSNHDLANMFLSYLEEEKIYAQKSKNIKLNRTDGCFCYSKNGAFAVREYAQGWLNSDITSGDMLKTLLQSEEWNSYPFTKDDITKIEFARVGSGSSTGSFKTVYSYEIRLNDQSVITYKPCITRTASLGTGIFGFLRKKSADRDTEQLLLNFRQFIGSDLPVVKVKKF